MTPISGFAPDASPLTPGILLDCAHLIPYESGYIGAPSPVGLGSPALSAECFGAVMTTKLDGTRRIFAGTATKIYELSGNAWVDRSAATYGASADNRWMFCQFGDITIATDYIDSMQQSAATNFSAIAGAPKAKIVVSAGNNFVIAFNTNEATYGVSPDRWWCCAQGDATNWTPNVSTLATTGRLASVEGEIVAALPLGDNVIVYKNKAIYVGVFAGSPVVWQWALIPSGDIGAVGQRAVCDIGGAHFIVSRDNFWIFDGTRPIPIGDGSIRKWFFSNASDRNLYKTRCVFDRRKSLVRVSYASESGSGSIDSAIVYHVAKKQWGRDDLVEQAALEYTSPAITWDSLSAISSTWDGLPSVPWDSPFWSYGARAQAYVDGSNALMTLSGPCTNSSFTTGDMGDAYVVTAVDKFRVQFEQSPASATATGYHKQTEGDALVTGPSSSLSDGRFDLRQSGRFHRVKVDMVGDVKVMGYHAKPILMGAR